MFEDKNIKKAKEIVEYFKQPKDDEEIFYQLCFCICSPQCTYDENMKSMNNLIAIDFYCRDVETDDIASQILSSRFYRQKADRLQKAKRKFDAVLIIVREILDYCSHYNLREWLVDNIKGMGMKTSSMFLRNMGSEKLAVIDTHIIKFLNDVLDEDITTPSSNKQYLELEKKVQNIAKEKGISTAVLDVLVWKYYTNNSWQTAGVVL